MVMEYQTGKNTYYAEYVWHGSLIVPRLGGGGSGVIWRALNLAHQGRRVLDAQGNFEACFTTKYSGIIFNDACAVCHFGPRRDCGSC